MSTIQLFKTQPIFKNIFKSDVNNREINIYKIEDVRPTGYNLYYPTTLLYNIHTCKTILPLLEKTMSLKCGTIYEKNNMLFDVKQSLIQTIFQTPLYYFIYNTDNYFHYLYDTMPYLISYIELKKEIPTLKLLMQYPNPQKNEMYPFVLELLELLNISTNDIVIIDENTLYKSVYISTSYTHDFDSNLPPRNEIYELYQHIANIVRDIYPKIVSPSKIYVSRRTHLHNDFSNIGTNYTTRRRLINEDELVDSLVRDGFIEVFTEKLTTIQKIQYFMNATDVVGAIGGGISNVLFSPNRTKLEAIISPTFLDVNSRFKYSLDCVNTTYNFNTKHYEMTEFKLYMRVRYCEIVGEIKDIYDNKLLISYTEDGTNTGWNSQCQYKQIEVYTNEVIKLDDGLNSSWEICIN
jgi:hypothetical protein